MNKRGHVLNALLLSIGLGYVLEPSGDVVTFEMIAAVIVPVVLGAMVPDIDTAFGRHRKTLHNLFVPLVVGAYPYYHGNLEYVWIGVLSHFALDLLGSRRGLALLYPLTDEEFNLPIGVPVDSKYAEAMMLAVTGFELALAAMIVYEIPQYAFEAGLKAVGLS
ncbi:membrane-bound metal-dependent hydrolase [Halorhabdus utahensis DSM 12940]|uniref:Membrane-bound metal-dependent hydrolase n=1 Tax=Halorhabdus utahensis (strain DSM 12940 / JCM 11049 / AX-2) TaxID=519442 RepID=C7NMJ3_HALUD|nr:metal-dependent hydrolase [Halorhabdus utahensis]ACV12632.1 membrane-bound metal-dependent hydrolase [Halorhabdus utahensis DSM 12940]